MDFNDQDFPVSVRLTHQELLSPPTHVKKKLTTQFEAISISFLIDADLNTKWKCVFW